MNINVPYDVGYRFFAPRVRSYLSKDTVIVNGKEYSRTEDKLVAYVIEKEIVEITVSIDSKDVDITYHVVDVDDRVFPKMYRSDLSDFGFINKNDAQKFANEWLIKNNTPYYGSG